MTFAETWPHADPDAVGGGDGDLTPPADGLHEATLVGGGAWTSKKGVDWVRFEFVLNDGSEFKWAVLHGFKSQAQAGFTKREVRALGIDVEQLESLDAIDAAIKEKLGGYYVVRVERDGKFESTYVEDAAVPEGAPAAPAPAAASAAAPVPAGAPAGATGTDDDIPF